MKSRDFVYWLQGYFEILTPDAIRTSLSEAQVDVIRNHLNMVFKHEIGPSFGDKKVQEDLQNIHSGGILQGTIDGLKFNC